MTLQLPSGGGSPERGGLPSTGEGGGELRRLNRRLFLSASNYMNSLGSYSLFDSYPTEGSSSDVLRRALEVSVLDMSVIERPGQYQTYQEIMEKDKADKAINNYISTYSKDDNFVDGFRLIKEFVRGLKPYLDGTGGEARLNQDGMITIGKDIEIPAIQIRRLIAEDSRGYKLVQLASATFIKGCKAGVLADDRKRTGIEFAETLFKMALVETTQAGKGSPILQRLAKLYPGTRAV